MRIVRRSRGVAIITALLITALVGSLAASLAWDNALDVRRTMTLMFHDQGMQVAFGAESWVSNILRDDSIDSTTDHLGELWASELPGLPVDNDSVQGAVTGKIDDLNGRFNVNNLLGSDGKVDPEYLAQFERLLVALELDPKFAGLTVDWIDADQEAGFPNGAEDAIYSSMLPPYRPFNQPILNVTELAALEGMSKAIFDQLKPHITALPGKTPVNVNTATAAVLMSLSEEIDAVTAEALIEEREEAGFADYRVRFGQYFSPDTNLDNAITENSEYFQLKAVVQIDTVRVIYFSTLHRTPNGGPVTTLFRSVGTS